MTDAEGAAWGFILTAAAVAGGIILAGYIAGHIQSANGGG